MNGGIADLQNEILMGKLFYEIRVKQSQWKQRIIEPKMTQSITKFY